MCRPFVRVRQHCNAAVEDVDMPVVDVPHENAVSHAHCDSFAVRHALSCETLRAHSEPHALRWLYQDPIDKKAASCRPCLACQQAHGAAQQCLRAPLNFPIATASGVCWLITQACTASSTRSRLQEWLRRHRQQRCRRGPSRALPPPRPYTRPRRPRLAQLARPIYELYH